MNAVELAMRLKHITDLTEFDIAASQGAGAIRDLNIIGYRLGIGCLCPCCYPNRKDKTITWDDIIYCAQQEQL